MTNNGVVTWNDTKLRTKTRSASELALHKAAEFGHAYWDQTVPVSTDPRTSGDLKRSWLSYIDANANSIILVISANTKHAIYVELGTSKMLPRAPLRATGGEIAAILPFYVVQELKA